MAERQYWLHRITGGANAWAFAHHLLEEANLLSIGWSDFSTDEFLENVRSQGMHYVEEEMKRDWAMSTAPRNRWSLWRFIMEMKQGDWILVPTYKQVNIYEIVDDVILSNSSLEKNYPTLLKKYDVSRDNNYLFQGEQKKLMDLGFYRRVNIVKTKIPRANYCEASLVSRMKILQTNANISDLEKEILRAVQDTPIILKEEIIASAEPVIYERIQKVADSDKFESLVQWYLESIGAVIIKTPAKNSSPTEEGDADKVAYFGKLNLVVMVQIKKHFGKTGDWAVQQITSYAKNSAPEQEESGQICALWVISAGDDYTTEAKLMAKEHNVRLINGHEFARLILEVGVDKMPL